jgi:hypothetical protein
MRSIVVVLGAVLAVGAPPALGGEEPAGKHCVGAEEARAHATGEGAPPKFSWAFYAHTYTLDASLDGMDGKTLPVSIEEICDVPKPLAKQAARLAGNDGIALLSARTRVSMDGQNLQGNAALTALDGADTALLRVRLAPQSQWGEDEDGDKVPTFLARRITITD